MRTIEERNRKRPAVSEQVTASLSLSSQDLESDPRYPKPDIRHGQSREKERERKDDIVGIGGKKDTHGPIPIT